uniref:Putative secreted protein n=1 Tax=Rhipicephalus microplus TaxID=6941 RepID=A0A6G5A1B4_RHIMP
MAWLICSELMAMGVYSAVVMNCFYQSQLITVFILAKTFMSGICLSHFVGDIFSEIFPWLFSHSSCRSFFSGWQV